MHGGQTRCTVVYVQIMNDTTIKIKTTCCCCCWCSNKKQSISSEMKLSDVVAFCIRACRERINLQVIFYFFNCLIHVGELNSGTSKLHVVTCSFFYFHKAWVKYAFLIQESTEADSNTVPFIIAESHCSIMQFSNRSTGMQCLVLISILHNILDQVNLIISIVAFSEATDLTNCWQNVISSTGDLGAIKILS